MAVAGASTSGRCNRVRASGYLDEILFSVGSPAVSRDSFIVLRVPVPSPENHRRPARALYSADVAANVVVVVTTTSATSDERYIGKNSERRRTRARAPIDGEKLGDRGNGKGHEEGGEEDERGAAKRSFNYTRATRPVGRSRFTLERAARVN